MADVIKNSFVESRRHSAVLFQRGKDVIDFELNELQDVLRVAWYRTAAAMATTSTPQRCASADDGWKIVDAASPNVTVSTGSAVCGGILITSFVATSVALAANPDAAQRIIAVYLTVQEQEIADPEQIPALGETTRRRRILPTVALAYGASGAPPAPPAIPADTAEEIWEGGTRYFLLAYITQQASGADVVSIQDMREKLAPAVLEGITTQWPGTTGPAVTGNWELTCGNGVSTFGDFNGQNALQAAFTFLSELAPLGYLTDVSISIYLKAGTYRLTSDVPAMFDATSLRLRGDGPDDSVIELFTTGIRIEQENALDLSVTMEDLSVIRGTAGSVFVVSTNDTGGSTYLNCQRVHFVNTPLWLQYGQEAHFTACHFVVNDDTVLAVPMVRLFAKNASGQSYTFDRCYFYTAPNGACQRGAIQLSNSHIGTRTVDILAVRDCVFRLRGGTGEPTPHDHVGPLMFASTDGVPGSYGDWMIRELLFTNNTINMYAGATQPAVCWRLGSDHWVVNEARVEGLDIDVSYASVSGMGVTPFLISAVPGYDALTLEGIKRLTVSNVRMVANHAAPPNLSYAAPPSFIPLASDSAVWGGLLAISGVGELVVRDVAVEGCILDCGIADISLSATRRTHVERLSVDHSDGGIVSGAASYPYSRVCVFNTRDGVVVEECTFKTPALQFVDTASKMGFLGFPRTPGSLHNDTHCVVERCTFVGGTLPVVAGQSMLHLTNIRGPVEVLNNTFTGSGASSYGLYVEATSVHPSCLIAGNCFYSSSVMLEWSWDGIGSHTTARLSFLDNTVMGGSCDAGGTQAQSCLVVVQLDTPPLFSQIDVSNNRFNSTVETFPAVVWGDASDNYPRGVFIGNILVARTGSTPALGVLQVRTSAVANIRGLEVCGATALNAQSFAMPASPTAMAFNQGVLSA